MRVHFTHRCGARQTSGAARVYDVAHCTIGVIAASGSGRSCKWRCQLTVDGRRFALAVAFAGAARRYWLGVFPSVCLERRRRRARALADPRPAAAPRRAGVPVQVGQRRGRGGVRGVRATPPSRRGGARDDVPAGGLQLPGRARRAAELRSGRQRQAAAPGAARRARPGARRIWTTTRTAPSARTAAICGRSSTACRAALGALPSYPAVAPAALRAAERIVEFQSCNTGERQGDLAGAGALGARGDAAGIGPALVGGRGGGRILAVRVCADRARGRPRARPAGGGGRRRTPTFPGSARCTRCSTTSWTRPRIAPPGSTA